MARKDERSSGDANNTAKDGPSKKQIADAFAKKVNKAEPEKRGKMIADLIKHKGASDRDRN